MAHKVDFENQSPSHWVLLQYRTLLVAEEAHTSPHRPCWLPLGHWIGLDIFTAYDVDGYESALLCTFYTESQLFFGNGVVSEFGVIVLSCVNAGVMPDICKSTQIIPGQIALLWKRVDEVLLKQAAERDHHSDIKLPTGLHLGPLMNPELVLFCELPHRDIPGQSDDLKRVHHTISSVSSETSQTHISATQTHYGEEEAGLDMLTEMHEAFSETPLRNRHSRRTVLSTVDLTHSGFACYRTRVKIFSGIYDFDQNIMQSSL